MKTEAITYLIKAIVTYSDNTKSKVRLFELNEIEFQQFKSQLSACLVAKSLYEKSIQENLTFMEFHDEFLFSYQDEEFCWMKQMSIGDLNLATRCITKIQNQFELNEWLSFKDITDFTCEKKTTIVTTEYENILIDF